MADSEVKGYIVMATDRYVRELYDPSAQERIRGRLSEDTRQTNEKLARSKWYPAGCWTELIESVVQEAPSPADRLERMKTVGRYLAMDATGTYLRLLLKLFTPGLFLRRLPTFFERDMRPGRVATDLSKLDDRKVLLTILGADEFSYLAPISSGWIEYVFEQIGVKGSDVKILNPTGDVTRSGDIRLEITWN
jgi:hypothetical protein